MEKELNQAINRNIDLNQEVNVLDISKSIEGKITKEKVKQKIQELIDKKEPIKTLSDPYMMELLNKKRSHIINGSRYGKLTPKEFKARNNQLLNVDTLIKNSVLIEKVENTKKDKKPDVDNYYYFYTPIKDGNNTYIVKLVAENSKKENIVNLYDVLTEKELKVNDKGTKSKLMSVQDGRVANNSSILYRKYTIIYLYHRPSVARCSFNHSSFEIPIDFSAFLISSKTNSGSLNPVNALDSSIFSISSKTLRSFLGL